MQRFRSSILRAQKAAYQGAFSRNRFGVVEGILRQDAVAIPSRAHRYSRLAPNSTHAPIHALIDQANVLHEGKAISSRSKEDAALDDDPVPPQVLQNLSELGQPESRSGLLLNPNELPVVCPGCGAYSQVTDSSLPGYYNADREDLQLWLSKKYNILSEEDQEMTITQNSLANLDPALLDSLGIESPDPTPRQTTAQKIPICGRCHALTHHNDMKQQSIIHPSISSIQTMLDESPYKQNHVYHVVDAADFPMSLIPNISNIFDISMRTKNRRSKSHRWSGGQQNAMSFVITRSDLIARNKFELEKMMPYLQTVLRDALGRHGEKVRLGNLWCVSARDGWWTTKLREKVYSQRGGGWLVGKVNVGKSALYKEIFPKGHKDEVKTPREADEELGLDESHRFLPPLPEETNYPSMPTVSQLPGTTAMPVRHSYGNGKGELIDLPGLPRNGLYEAVNPAKAPYLYHKNRIRAEQFTIHEGRSLLISNLIQIKPVDPKLIILAAPFIPLPCSVRDEEFAVGVLDQTQPATTARNIARNTARPEIARNIASAGTFKLSWDITKERAGPLVRRDAVALKPGALHFKVFGADILIEGVGWVELSCQVRKRYLEEQEDPHWVPEVKVLSPQGKFIGIRQPMNAYLRIGDHPKPKSQRSQRPRRSMKGVKKEEKRRAREARVNTAISSE